MEFCEGVLCPNAAVVKALAQVLELQVAIGIFSRTSWQGQAPRDFACAGSRKSTIRSKAPEEWFTIRASPLMLAAFLICGNPARFGRTDRDFCRGRGQGLTHPTPTSYSYRRWMLRELSNRG